jgi:sigma-54 dependent transcriptional regulator, acetoin dehydrogenase operon transcriptional activator AcoR
MPPSNLVVQNAWHQYLAGASLDVRSLSVEVASSWQRCHNLSVDPLCLQSVGIDQAQLQERLYQRQCLIKIARPVMERLYNFVKNTGFQVVLSDETGFLLEVIGDPDITTATRQVEMCPGGTWSEASKGTNAIGTAIFERKPVQVYAAEHYCQPNHFLVCSASPIFDVDGQMVGVLDLSGDYHHSNVHTLGMVVAAVGAIETQLRLQRATEKLYNAYRYSNILLQNMSDGMVSIDNRGVVTEINAKAAGIFGIDPKSVRGRHLSELTKLQLPLLQLLTDGVQYEEKEIVCSPLDKKIRSSASLLRDEAGAVIGAVATFREVSKSKASPRQYCLAASRLSIDDIVGDSANITDLKDRARMAATSLSTVLLEGESGTGKELVAQAIHYSGQRSAGPFIAVNCAALPESLIESELLGYEDGSFTGAKKGGHAGKFEMANHGTLFLDEIGDMPLCAQMKMLRVIQERKVTRIGATVDREIDIRIIAATLKDLKQEVKEGRFRQDLYYRLNVLNLRIPPLRERLEDIPALARNLAFRIAARMKVDSKDFEEGLLDRLKFYPWPGNVRELENMIERAINLAGDDPILRAEYFELANQEAGMQSDAPFELAPVRPLDEMEQEMIRRAIAFHKGNINKAAISLGISRNTLYRKMKEYEVHSSASSPCA